jgi:hypothetical protein
MKNYKKIRRIFEQEAISPDATAELGMNPQMSAPMDSEMPPMDHDAMNMPQDALPAPGETSTPIDPMSMTVRDFVNKCKEIDPLVCMGIESFIAKNQQSFVEPAAMAPTPDTNMSFSNVVDGPVAPAPAQNFSLDQSPEALNFPA